MTQTKTNCTNCGSLILETTAQKNNGLCVPCNSENEILQKHKEKQSLKKANVKTYNTKRKLITLTFIWLFIFFVMCGGIYVNYQNYTKGEELSWISLTSLICFVLMFLIHSYQFIVTIKNIKSENENI